MEERVLYGLLVQSPKSEPVRILLQKQLVELALLGSPVPRSIPDICQRIAGIMRLGTKYQRDRAVVGIQKAIEYGTVDEIGESTYQLTELGRANLHQQGKETREVEDMFEECLLATIAKPIQPYDYGRDLVEAVKQDLATMMEQKAGSLTDSIIAGKTLMDESKLQGYGFPCLESRLSETKLSELDRVGVLISVRQVLLQGSKAVSSYVTSLYRRAFYHKMLLHDPAFQRLQLEQIAKWTLYLDTNVIFALLFPKQPLHTSVVAALKRCEAVGCRMLVSSITLAEFRNQVRVASTLYSRYTSGDARPEPDFALTANQFILDYTLRFGMAMDFDTYLRQYDDLDRILAGDHGVHADSLTYEIEPEDLKIMKGRVLEAKRVWGASMAERTVEHDARSLIMVATLRKALPPGEPDRRIWLLTLDRSLRRIRPTQTEEQWEPPCDLRFDELMELMSVLSAPDFTGISDQEYAKVLLSSAIGTLSPDISELVGEFIDGIVESGMEIVGLPQERRDAVLRALALDKEAHSLAACFARTSDEANRQKIEEQMAALAESYLTQIEERAVDSSIVDNLNEALATHRREMGSLRNDMAKLENRYDQEKRNVKVLRVAVVMALGTIVVLLVLLCCRL